MNQWVPCGVEQDRDARREIWKEFDRCVCVRLAATDKVTTAEAEKICSRSRRFGRVPATEVRPPKGRQDREHGWFRSWRRPAHTPVRYLCIHSPGRDCPR